MLHNRRTDFSSHRRHSFTQRPLLHLHHFFPKVVKEVYKSYYSWVIFQDCRSKTDRHDPLKHMQYTGRFCFQTWLQQCHPMYTCPYSRVFPLTIKRGRLSLSPQSALGLWSVLTNRVQQGKSVHFLPGLSVNHRFCLLILEPYLTQPPFGTSKQPCQGEIEFLAKVSDGPLLAAGIIFQWTREAILHVVVMATTSLLSSECRGHCIEQNSPTMQAEIRGSQNHEHIK